MTESKTTQTKTTEIQTKKDVTSTIAPSKESIVQASKEDTQLMDPESNYKSVLKVKTKGTKEISEDQRGNQNKSDKKKFISKEKVSTEKNLAEKAQPTPPVKNDVILSKEPIPSKEQISQPKLSQEPSATVVSKEMLPSSTALEEKPKPIKTKPPIRQISYAPFIAVLCPVVTVYIVVILLIIFWYVPTIICYGEHSSASSVAAEC